MHELWKIVLVTLPLMAFIILIGWFLHRLRHPKLSGAEQGGMKKISGNPTYFLSALFKDQYYFDSEYFYEIKNNVTFKIPLSAIISVRPGHTQVNNRRNWRVTFRHETGERSVQFYSNPTFFNQNFAEFLAVVKRENPHADVKDLSFFNL